MGRWWRAHDEAVDDPKLQQLRPELFKAWFNLCCITSQNDGALPPIADIAFKLRMKPEKARSIVAELVALRLIDMDEEGVAAPHNWAARQFKSDVTDSTNAERQKRYRERHPVTASNGVTPVTVTDTRAETEQITEKKDAAGAALDSSSPSPVPDPEKELFRRGKEICGSSAGGLIAKLKKAKGGNVALARAALEMASTRSDPREYLGAIIAGGHATGDGRRLTNDEQYYGVGRTPGII